MLCGASADVPVAELLSNRHTDLKRGFRSQMCFFSLPVLTFGVLQDSLNEDWVFGDALRDQ